MALEERSSELSELIIQTLKANEEDAPKRHMERFSKKLVKYNVLKENSKKESIIYPINYN